MTKNNEIEKSAKNKEFEIASIHLQIKRPLLKEDNEVASDNAKMVEKSIVPSFNEITQEFVTLLQMLWKYMHGIGAVAEQTALANIVSIEELKELNSNKTKQIIIRYEE